MELSRKEIRKPNPASHNSVVRSGTTLHSDQWKAYLNISRDLGFRHQTVNHRENFVDPITGVHTQSIESYWNRQKKLDQEYER